MRQAAGTTVDHPFFARVWPVAVNHESRAVRALRRENLAGLSSRRGSTGNGHRRIVHCLSNRR